MADRKDEARVLGDRDEGRGRNEAAIGMLPAQKRLRAHDAAGGHVHLRLIMQLEAALVDRPPEPALEREALDGGCVHRGRVVLIRGAPLLLGVVHRRVGVADQRLGRLSVLGVRRYADAGRHDHVRLLGPDRLRQMLENPARHRARRETVARLRQQDHELVAAEPREDRLGDRLHADRRFEIGFVLGVMREHVLRAHEPAQGIRELLEQRVRAVMTDRVVDELEVVEVEEQHGELESLAPRTREHLLEMLVQEPPIRQPRQAVLIRQGLDLLVRGGQLLQRILARRSLRLELLVDALELGRAPADERLQILHLERDKPPELPAPLQRVRELPHLDGIEGLLEYQHAVGVSEGAHHILGAVVGVRRADHDADIGVALEQPHRGLDAVDARRHAHVDERERIGPARLPCGLDALDGLSALKGGVELEARMLVLRLAAEQLVMQRVELFPAASPRAEYLAKVLVDRLVVVHDEDAAVHGGRLARAPRVRCMTHVLRPSSGRRRPRSRRVSAG